MLKGTEYRILNQFDFAETLNVLCTFSWNQDVYLLAIDDTGRNVLRKLKYRTWKGTYVESVPSEHIPYRIGEILREEAKQDPEFYRFRAEHYTVFQTKEGLKFRKSGKHLYLKKRTIIRSFYIKLMTAVLLAILYALFCVNFTGLSPVRTLFGGLSKTEAKVLVYLIQPIGATALFMLKRAEWSFLDLSINALIPYNFLTLCCVVRTNVPIRIAAIGIAAVFLLFGILPKVIQAIRTRKKKQKALYWKTAVRRCYLPLILCATIAFMATNFLGVECHSLKSSDRSEYNENIDAFEQVEIRLEAERWRTHDSQEKLDILQQICDYECKFDLGCRTPQVVASYPRSPIVLGDYDCESNRITINTEHLEQDDVKSVLNTLLHETRHAYQHAAAQALDRLQDSIDEEDMELECFKTVAAYRDNLDNYISGGYNTFYEYYDQEVEQDSRSWAEWRIEEEYAYYMYPNFEIS